MPECTSKSHLSEGDKRLLKVLRIRPWECPQCGKPSLRTEPPQQEEKK